jgi:hypothetical protein
MIVFELLKRASEKLEDYCSEVNGDMNDSLATEIDAFVKTGGWRTDFENIPNDDFMFEDYTYNHYTIPVVVTVLYASGKKEVMTAYSYQFKPDVEEYKNRWVHTGADGKYVNGEVIAYQLLPEPYKG